MDELVQFSEKLKGLLADDLEDAKVSAILGRLRKIFGVVVSPTFEGMHEGKRQELVWKKVLDHFTPYEQSRIDFIYTDAPSEVATSTITNGPPPTS